MSLTRYERSISATAPKEIDSAKIEPTKPANPGTLVIGGGEIPITKEEHKDWGQVVAKDLEIPSNFHGMVFQPAAGGQISVPVGKYGHIAVAASGSVTINVEKPAAVPEKMWLPKGSVSSDQDRHRYRVFYTTVYIYYKGPTQLTINGDIQYGYDDYKLTRMGEGGAVLEEDDTTTPVLSYALEKVFKSYELKQREPTTGDAFLITYDERMGRAIITPLALEQPNAADPTNPEDGEKDPEEDPEDPDDDNSDRVDEAKPPSPPEGIYVDEDGNILVPEAPPARPGSPIMVALHRAGFTFSIDGGATWRYRDIKLLQSDPAKEQPKFVDGVQVNAGSDLKSRLIDIQGGTGEGFWLLCEDGTTLYSPTIAGNFVQTPVGDSEAVEIDFEIQNRGFENRDFTNSWPLMSGTYPFASISTDPPQRAGSERYMASSDVGKVFRVQQPIQYPDELKAQFAAAEITEATFDVDVYADDGAIAAAYIEKELDQTLIFIKTGSNGNGGYPFGPASNIGPGVYARLLNTSIPSGGFLRLILEPMEGGTFSNSIEYSSNKPFRLNYILTGSTAEEQAQAIQVALAEIHIGKSLFIKKADVLRHRAFNVDVIDAGEFWEFKGNQAKVQRSPSGAFITVEAVVDVVLRRNAEITPSANGSRVAFQIRDSKWIVNASGGTSTVTLGFGEVVGSSMDPSLTTDQRWTKIRFSFPLVALEEGGYYIALEGKGDNKVYFDNVRIYGGQSSEPIRAMSKYINALQFHTDTDFWRREKGVWEGNPGLPFSPTGAAGGKEATDLSHCIYNDSQVAFLRNNSLTFSPPITKPSGSGLFNSAVMTSFPTNLINYGGPFLTTEDGHVFSMSDDFMTLESRQKWDDWVTGEHDTSREKIFFTRNEGQTSLLTVVKGAPPPADAEPGDPKPTDTHEYVDQRPQPINTNFIKRRTLATARGTYFGYSTLAGDIYWTTAPGEKWKLLGSVAVKTDAIKDPFSETIPVEPPEEPVEPEEPPVDPEEPTDPEEPVDPIDAEPTSVEDGDEEPIDPEDPEEPVDPEEPPVDPEEPIDPETPVDPETPLPPTADPTAPKFIDGRSHYPIIIMRELR